MTPDEQRAALADWHTQWLKRAMGWSEQDRARWPDLTDWTDALIDGLPEWLESRGLAIAPKSADVYVGPIEHHESQTVECWCRHCVWWRHQAEKPLLALLVEARELLERHPGHGAHGRRDGMRLEFDDCLMDNCPSIRDFIARLPEATDE